MTAPLDTLIAYSVAALTTGGGLALVIKQVRVALFKRAEAQSARIVAEAERDRLVAEARVKNAEAAKLRAEAEVEQARAHRADAEGEVAHTAISAEMLARYEARLTKAEERSERAEARAERAEKRVDECERRHVERESVVAALRETVAVQAAEIATLRERVDGMTPQPFKAAKERR